MIIAPGAKEQCVSKTIHTSISGETGAIKHKSCSSRNNLDLRKCGSIRLSVIIPQVQSDVCRCLVLHCHCALILKRYSLS